jgi:hypothetical protein
MESLKPVWERNQRIVGEWVPLALALGTAGADPVRAIPRWQMPVLPYTTGKSWQLWPSPFNIRQRAAPLSDQDIHETKRWARLINDYHHDEISFVGRRIVSALTARWTLEDVLVDSVVAWENLIGGAPETTFRTSVGMSSLLETDTEKRLALQYRLTKIYNVRSDVVHGRLGPSMDQWKWRLAKGEEKVGLDVVANEALDVAMRGLKALIETRADLIPLSADERCRRLLMGA